MLFFLHSWALQNSLKLKESEAAAAGGRGLNSACVLPGEVAAAAPPPRARAGGVDPKELGPVAQGGSCGPEALRSPPLQQPGAQAREFVPRACSG